MSNESVEAIQIVVDRVSSWQESATEGTVEQELRDGFQEVGVSVDEADVTKLAEAIKADGQVDAASVLA